MTPKIHRMDHLFRKQGRAMALVIVLVVVLMPSTVAMAGQTGWAHQVGGMQSNGQVIVKSLSGASYSATQNPVGAVVKANQNAATQPPTVIIQATAAATRECQPKIKGSSALNVTMPACPAGYSSIFQESTALSVNSCPLEVNQTYNIASTNWSFGLVSVANAQAVGFMNDNKPSGNSGNLPASLQYVICSYGSNTYSWAANLCCK